MQCHIPARIRIRIGSGFNGVLGSGSAFAIWIRIQESKNNQQKYKKLIMFIFWSAGCSLSRAEGFPVAGGVLFGGLRVSKLQFLIKKEKNLCSCLFSIFGHPNAGLVSGSGFKLKCWIRVRIRIQWIRIHNTDFHPNIPPPLSSFYLPTHSQQQGVRRINVK